MSTSKREGQSDLEANTDRHPHFSVINGNLLYKDRLLFSAQSSLIPTILNTYHDSVLGGHSGYLRTYKRISFELYWRGILNLIKQYVSECDTCQRKKSSTLAPFHIFWKKKNGIWMVGGFFNGLNC